MAWLSSTYLQLSSYIFPQAVFNAWLDICMKNNNIILSLICAFRRAQPTAIFSTIRTCSKWLPRSSLRHYQVRSESHTFTYKDLQMFAVSWAPCPVWVLHYRPARNYLGFAHFSMFSQLHYQTHIRHYDSKVSPTQKQNSFRRNPGKQTWYKQIWTSNSLHVLGKSMKKRYVTLHVKTEQSIFQINLQHGSTAYGGILFISTKQAEFCR